ncbi:MAG: hypothetical protein QY311_02520 [Candidatus Paceibacterota bacterium]|nr:MAG: hypothetical protein QY311_02520 [Candidatus Paceibacterota bacterium]
MFKATCQSIADAWWWFLPLTPIVVGMLFGSVAIGLACYFALGFWFLHRYETWGREDLALLCGFSRANWKNKWERVTVTGAMWLTLVIWPLGYYVHKSGVADKQLSDTEGD